jgi:hypothetical protein
MNQPVPDPIQKPQSYRHAVSNYAILEAKVRFLDWLILNVKIEASPDWQLECEYFSQSDKK